MGLSAKKANSTRWEHISGTRTAVNSTCGCVIGNKLVCMISQILAGNIRFFDVVGRWEALLIEQAHICEEDTFIKITISAGTAEAHISDLQAW